MDHLQQHLTAPLGRLYFAGEALSEQYYGALHGALDRSVIMIVIMIMIMIMIMMLQLAVREFVLIDNLVADLLWDSPGYLVALL